MTTETQLPKLSTLSPEQRRILCAEALGWTFDHRRKTGIDPKDGIDRFINYPFTSKETLLCTVPDPDRNANDALVLVEHAAKNGWRCECNCGTAFHWECIFHRDLNADEQKIQRDHSMMAAHNEGLIGMPQGPCQCDICQCRRIEYYAPADTFCEALTSAFLLATGKAEL